MKNLIVKTMLPLAPLVLGCGEIPSLGVVDFSDVNRRDANQITTPISVGAVDAGRSGASGSVR